MEVQLRPSTRMSPQRIIRTGEESNFICHYATLYLVLLCSILFFGTCGVSVLAADEKQTESISSNQNAENPVPQVRYRTRPVQAFRTGPKTAKNGNSTTNSSETDGPEPSGVPFIAVHDLTSQTFEKLQENWRNVEAFIRNFQARRSQEESLRSSPSSSGGSPPTGDKENIRRTPYNNVYTFKYHPVVLQGEGSSSVDDIIGGNSRGTPQRTFNGVSFNPFPFDPKGEGSKNVDLERHTIATIYTIGICLTIIVVGGVITILINKCDGTGGNNYTRANAVSGAGNRITRSVIGAARGGRQTGNSNNGRSRNSRGGRSNESSSNAASSASTHVSGVNEIVAKYATDLPPSYDSLFPEGGPSKLQDVPELATTSTASANNILSVINDSSEQSRPPGLTSADC